MAHDINKIPEATKLLDLITRNDKFRTTYRWLNSPEYNKAVKELVANANAAKDPITFLTNVLSKYDPSFKTLKPNMKVAPGKNYRIDTPNIAIDPSAAEKYLPSPEKQAQIKALQDKIAAHNEEIRKLNAAKEKATRAAEKAAEEHAKINPIFDEKTLKYFAYIEANCGEYLKAVRETGKILYRGQRDSQAPIFVGYPRENRRTKDSSEEAQKLYDKYLTMMGFSALRSNSIFTTSSEHQADEYGYVYAIFPKDGFKFTWSTKMGDLVLESMSDVDKSQLDPEEVYYEFNDVFEDINNELNALIYDTEEETEKVALKKSPAMKAFRKLLSKWDDMNYWGGDTKKIYRVALETAEGFLTLSQDVPQVKKLSSQIKEAKKTIAVIKKKEEISPNKAAASAMIKKFGLLNTNLVAALKSGHEVCILGEYVAVGIDDYEKQIKSYFLTNNKPKAIKKVPTKKKIAKPNIGQSKEPAELGGSTNKKPAGSVKGFKV